MNFPSVPWRILVVSGLLVAALIGLVVREGAARAEGQEVALPITGYDPRELLTGHYVQFQIQTEQPPQSPCPPSVGDGARGSMRWVALAPRGRLFAPVAEVATRAEALKHGPVAVRARLLCFGSQTLRDPQSGLTRQATTVQIDVGIDRLHVDQQQAEAIQKALRIPGTPGEAYVILSVGHDGKARLKGLVAAGKRAELTWF